MRNFATLFILIIGFINLSHNNCNAQKKCKKCPSVTKDLPSFFVNDALFPKYLKAIYKRDATRLSIRLLNKELRLSQQTVDVPEELVQAVYNALVAIRVSDYSAIDTISQKYYIRSFPVPNVENIILVADHDAPWLEPLKHRERLTGSESINEIIRKYQLNITRMVYLDEERVGLLLQSSKPLNIPALTLEFFTEEGIGSINEVLPFGDGNDISINRTKKGWELTYSLGFGDCMHQCQKRFDWKFTVSESGEVAYLGSAGHTIPPWVGNSNVSKRYPDILTSR
ncbi:MAG: hypothetical protein GY810_12580 [Aureispira sp.]|nr:hypothetical protein [Aureispira sp.]